MRKILALIMILVMLSTVPTVGAVVSIKESNNCAYAAYHPGAAIACFWEIMFNQMMGGGNWGDPGDSDGVAG